MRKYNMHVIFSKFNLFIGMSIIFIFMGLFVLGNQNFTLREVLLVVLGLIFILEEITKSIDIQYTYIFVRTMQFFKQSILAILLFIFRDISVVSCMCFLLYTYTSMEFLVIFKSKKIETRISVYGQMMIPLIVVFFLELYNEEFTKIEIFVGIILFINYLIMLRVVENYLLLSQEFLLKSRGNAFKVDENSNVFIEDDSKASSIVISRMLGIEDSDNINDASYYDRVIKVKDFEKFIKTIDICEDIQFLTKSILSSIDDVDYLLILLQATDDDKNYSLGIESVIGSDIVRRSRESAKEGQFLDFINNYKDIQVDNDVDLNKYKFFNSDDNINSVIVAPLKKDDSNVGICIVGSRSKNFFKESTKHIYLVAINEIVPKCERIFLCRMLEQLAIKDPLTGIYNRRYLTELFNEVENETDRVKGSKFKMSVALFEIDRFKRINDTYGHLFGDTVIKVCSKIANDITVENKGIMSRYGGEEFVLIFPGKEVEETEQILTNIMNEISNFNFISNEKIVNITISVGLTSYPEITKNVSTLLKEADYAMYYSKENGRSRITRYSRHVKSYLKNRNEI